MLTRTSNPESTDKKQCVSRPFDHPDQKRQQHTYFDYLLTMIDSFVNIRRVCTFLFAVATGLSLVSNTFGQDPFGKPLSNLSEAVGGGQRVVPQDPVDFQQSAEDLIESAIVDSNPESPGQLVQAIDSLLNIESYQVARQYLLQLANIQSNDKDFFDLHRSVGSTFFLRIATADSLQPMGNQYANRVLDAAFRYTYNPARLSAQVDRLNHENKFFRDDAFSQLKSAGESGAAAIIIALGDESRSAEHPRMRKALAQLGEIAEGPLLAAVTSPDDQMLAEATHALGFVPSLEAQFALYRPLMLGKTRRIRSIAATSLRRQLGRVPEAGEIERTLFRAASEYARPFVVDPVSADFDVAVWMIGNSGLEVTMVREDVAKHMLASQFAETLHMIRPNVSDYRRLYLVAVLQSVKSSGGLEQPLEAAFADSLQRRFNSEQINDALDAALEGGHVPAAIAACEVLHVADPDVLHVYQGRPSALIRALNFGDQRVAFAAVETITKLSADQAFSGSSNYASTLAYLGSSTGIRKALVGHVDSTMVQDLGQAVRSSGYTPTTATSSQQLYEIAISDPDIEIILVSDTLHRPDFLELVQSLRSHPRTRRIPIGFMYDFNSARDRIQHYLQEDALSAGFPSTNDASLVARQLEQVRLRGGIDTLQPSRRSFHARWCVKQLADLAKNRTRGSSYDLAAYETKLAETLYDSNLGLDSADILGQVGTRYSQQQLLGLANQSQQPLELRQRAVDSLAIAFDNNGILLTRSEILDQYRVYNASDTQPEASQQIYSQILDLFERKTNQDSPQSD